MEVSFGRASWLWNILEIFTGSFYVGDQSLQLAVLRFDQCIQIRDCLRLPLLQRSHLSAKVFTTDVGWELSLWLVIWCGFRVLFVDWWSFEFVLQWFGAIGSRQDRASNSCITLILLFSWGLFLFNSRCSSSTLSCRSLNCLSYLSFNCYSNYRIAYWLLFLSTYSCILGEVPRYWAARSNWWLCSRPNPSFYSPWAVPKQWGPPAIRRRTRSAACWTSRQLLFISFLLKLGRLKWGWQLATSISFVVQCKPANFMHLLRTYRAFQALHTHHFASPDDDKIDCVDCLVFQGG